MAKILFDTHIPVPLLHGQDFRQLERQKYAVIQGGQLYASESPLLDLSFQPTSDLVVEPSEFYIGPDTEFLMSGRMGRAAQMAVSVFIAFARIQNAGRLIPVSQTHIDACVYTGPASIRFAEYFLNQKDARTAEVPENRLYQFHAVEICHWA